MARALGWGGAVRSIGYLAGLGERARRRMPRFIFYFIEGGPDDEVGLVHTHGIGQAVEPLPPRIEHGFVFPSFDAFVGFGAQCGLDVQAWQVDRLRQ